MGFLNIYNLFKSTLKNLRTNKMRSFLTMLGIVIGITAVVVIVAVGNGAQSLILNQIKGVGSNLVGILPGASEEEGPPAAAMGIVITTLTNDDIKALNQKKNVEHAVSASAYVRGVTTVNWFDHKVDTNFVGTNYTYPNVEDTSLLMGNFFTEDEEKSKDKVVVLGYKVYKDLFEGVGPIGQNIKFEKNNFRVIGVMEERGVVAFQNPDNQVFIPLTTAQQFLLGIKHVSMARIKIDSEENVIESIEEIKNILRERHGITSVINDDFTVRSTVQALNVLTNVTNSIKYFLAVISALALVIGGIGIMNIMLITVNEKIKEIGLRKAVGATNRNIVIQFLAESVFMTLFGGFIGIILGVIISFIIAKVVIYLGYDWTFFISLKSIILAFGVSASIGLIFGIYPARKASKMDPIQALSYE
jgi:putative ABC transport system permease protein